MQFIAGLVRNVRSSKCSNYWRSVFQPFPGRWFWGSYLLRALVAIAYEDAGVAVEFLSGSQS